MNKTHIACRLYPCLYICVHSWSGDSIRFSTLPTYLPIYLSAYLPTYLPAAFTNTSVCMTSNLESPCCRMCTYAWTRICMYTCMNVYMYVCMYECVHVCMYLCVCIRMYTDGWMDGCMYELYIHHPFLPLKRQTLTD